MRAFGILTFLVACAFANVEAAEPVADDLAAKKQAITQYPDLGIPNTPLNKKFVELYRQAKGEDSGIFEDLNWPLALAKKAAEIVEFEKTFSSAPPDVQKFARTLPSLFWHAGDTFFRESQKTGGHFQPLAEFARQNRAEIQSVKPDEKDAAAATTVTFKLVDPGEPGEFWIMSFSGTRDTWVVQSAWKYLGGKKMFDLLVADAFTGSMKPFIERELKAYETGKDFSKAPPAAAK